MKNLLPILREKLFPLVFSVAIPIIVFLIFYHKVPFNAFFAGDAGIKYLEIVGQSMPGYGFGSFPYPAETMDPELKFLPGGTMAFKGHLHGAFSYMFAIGSEPFWRLFGIPGIYAIPLLGVVISLLFTFLLVKEATGIRRGFIAMVVLAGASPLMIYGVVIWEHSIAVALVLMGTWCWLSKKPVIIRDFFGGFFLGSTAWFRTEAYCFIFGMSIAFAIMNRSVSKRLITGACGVLGALAPLWIMNTILFGQPLGIEIFFAMHAGFWANILRVWERFPQLFVLIYPVTSFGAAMRLIVLIVIFCVGMVQRRAHPFMDEKIYLFLAWIVLIVNLWFLKHDLYSLISLAGVFPVILSIVVLCRYEKGTRAADARSVSFLSMGAAFSLVAFFITSPDPGGLEWGPRYLLPLVPLLCAIVFSFLPQKVKINEIAAVAVTVLLGFMVLLRGFVFVEQFKIRNAQLAHFTEQLVSTGEYIITDQRWFPQVNATLWFSRPMMVTKNKQDIAAIAQRLDNRNTPSFWLIQLVQSGNNPTINNSAPQEQILSYRLKESRWFQTTGAPIVFNHYTK